MTAVQPATRRAAPDGPFPGLTYYTEDYAELFFGRDVERGRIIGNLRVSRLTLLYAQSGVGKSSLLSAGVVPLLRHLAEEDLADDGAAAYVPVIFRSWSGDPLPELITEIERAIKPFVANGREAPQLPGDDLQKACELATEATGSTLLVILDQFEEYFNYHSTEGGPESFPEQLATCLNRADLRINVLIAIREDAYARIGDLLKGRIPSVYGNYLQLAHLGAKALHESITRAVSEFNRLYAPDDPVTVEPGIIENVLEQVSAATASQTGSGEVTTGSTTDTAFVQLVMKRLWDEEQAAGSRVLHAETLRRLGGAQTIIGTHLDSSMAKLNEHQQDIAASAFRFLVTPERAKIALGTKALSDWTGVPEDELETVLSALAMPDLRILRPVVIGQQSNKYRYEIFHDGLAEPILSWRARFEQIELEQERAAKEKAQREAAEAEAREEHERKRRRQWTRAAAASLAAFLGMAVLLALYWREQGAKERNNNYSIQIAERVAGLTEAPNFGPGAAALASVAANKLAPTLQARNAMLAYLQENPALPRIGVGHTRAVSSVAFIPGKQILVSTSYDGTVRFWDLSGNSVGSPLVAPTTSVVGLTSVAVSSGDPTLLAAARDDGQVDVWDIANPSAPKHVQTLALTTGGTRVNSVTFSPDGRYLVEGDNNGGLEGWDTRVLFRESGKKVVPAFHRTLDEDVNAIAYCPDNAPVKARGVLAVATTTSAWLWKPVLGGQGGTYKMYDKPTLSAACGADGTFAFGVNDRTDPGIVIEPWVGKEHYLQAADLIETLAFTEGGKVLVSGGEDWNVTLWHVETGRVIGPPMSMGAYDTVNGVAVSPDGKTIAAAGDGNLVKIWSTTTTGALAANLGSLEERECCLANRSYGNAPNIITLAIGANGQIATAGRSSVQIWAPTPSASGEDLPAPLTTIPAGYSPVDFHGNVLAVTNGSAIDFWNTAPPCNHGAVLPQSCLLGTTKKAGPATYATTAAFDRSGNVLATGEPDGKVKLWDVSNLKRPRVVNALPTESKAIDGLAFSPRDDLLMVTGGDGSLELWDVTDASQPTLIRSIPGAHEGLPATAAAFSPTAPLLATGGEDQQVRVWALDPAATSMAKRMTQTAQFSQTNTIQTLSFSPDGRVLVAGDGDGTACLYDLKYVRSIGSGDCLLGHGSQHGYFYSAIYTTAFTPDGKTLLTAGQDNPLIAWSSILWSENNKEIEDAVCRSAGENGTLTDFQWNAAFSRTPLAGKQKQICR